MPIKFNLTKYDLLTAKIKKLAGRDVRALTKEEQQTIRQAILISSFASGHSWRTYRALTAQSSTPMNDPELKQEHSEASTSKWKAITPFNIVEVSNMNIAESAFSQWLFFNVDRTQHKEFTDAWTRLQKEFAEDCDVVERERE